MKPTPNERKNENIIATFGQWIVGRASRMGCSTILRSARYRKMAAQLTYATATPYKFSYLLLDTSH